VALDRRDFIHLTAAGVLARTPLSRLATLAAGSARYKGYKAVAFDAFPIFDPRPIAALAETLFPGRGAELSNAWRTRQFEYQWLRALGGQYADFRETTESALVFACKQLRLVLTSENRAELMQAYLRLQAWPDVRPALDTLKNAGIRLALLSNMTATMLNTGISNAGLEGMFEHVLSTDRIRTYKPDPRAYQLGIDALRLRREEVVFAAFAGWDAAGAKWYGCRLSGSAAPLLAADRLQKNDVFRRR
jgi:2-haloacid dehalogenase